MLNTIKTICFIALLLFTSIENAHAQSITLHEGDLDKLLKENAVSTDNLWIVNGNRRFYQASEEKGSADEMVPLGKLSGLLWNIAAMRLIDKGAFTPDEPVFRLIEDYDFDSPFRETLTLRHLLAGTGGFATPPWYASKLGYDTQQDLMLGGKEWQKHITPITNPGLVGRDDIVGQALLAKALMSYWEQAYQKTIYDLVFAPMGITMDEVFIPDVNKPYDSFFSPVLNISISKKALVKLLTVISSNHFDDEDIFLSLVNYTALIKGDGWKVHPLGPGRSYGFFTSSIVGRRTASLMPSLDQKLMTPYSAALIAFPDAGIVIVMTKVLDQTLYDEIGRAAKVIAEEFIPQSNWFQERKATENFDEVRPRSGYFMLDDAATAWLGEKLYRAKYYSPFISVTRDKVTVSQSGQQRLFHRVESRVYQDAEGKMLYLSDLAGGYITIGDELYRYTGAMGNPNLLITPLPICLFILLTSAIYWRSKRGKDWRRFARWSIAGAILFSAGFYMEVTYYPTVWVEEQSLWAILLWRSAFNIGLMLILTAPMYAWRFGKQNDFHKNVKQMVIGSHVIVIAAAALTLALLSVAWGLAGELMP